MCNLSEAIREDAYKDAYKEASISANRTNVINVYKAVRSLATVAKGFPDINLDTIKKWLLEAGIPQNELE